MKSKQSAPANTKVYQDQDEMLYSGQQIDHDQQSSSDEYENDDIQGLQEDQKFIKQHQVQRTRQFDQQDVTRMQDAEQDRIDNHLQEHRNQKNMSIQAKSKKLEAILKRSAKRIKKQDEVDDDDLEKIKETYQKYLAKRQDKETTQNKKKKERVFDSKQDIYNLEITYESNRTICLFVFNIFVLIMIMFTIVGVGMLSLVVYIADDEVEILHSMPGQEQSLLHVNIFRPSILAAMTPIILFLILSIYLISMEVQDEMFFYMGHGQRGFLFLNICTFIMGFITMFCFGIFYMDNFSDSQTDEQTYQVHFSHLFLASLALIQISVLRMHASSKMSDVINGDPAHQKKL